MHQRQNERAYLKRKLELGINIHMPAPRRIGKTWTIKQLATDLRNEGWLVVEMDAQGIATEEKFARDLCGTIQKQLPNATWFLPALWHRGRGLIRGEITPASLAALASIDPIPFVRTLLEGLSKRSEPVAILIDEIAYFFLALAKTNAQAASAFAYQLRGLQLEYSTKVHWLLTGSVGLITVASQFGFEGAFVDLETFVLEPFTPAEASAFLCDETIQKSLARPFTAQAADLNVLFTEIGWLSPYYLKAVANEVRPSSPPAGAGQSPRATAADFEAAMTRLLDPNWKIHFAVWREHIQKNLPDTTSPLATLILNRLCETPEGETLDTIVTFVANRLPNKTQRDVKDILDILKIDGLISEENQRLRFRSGLVRRYWQKYEAE